MRGSGVSMAYLLGEASRVEIGEVRSDVRHGRLAARHDEWLWGSACLEHIAAHQSSLGRPRHDGSVRAGEALRHGPAAPVGRVGARGAGLWHRPDASTRRRRARRPGEGGQPRCRVRARRPPSDPPHLLRGPAAACANGGGRVLSAGVWHPRRAAPGDRCDGGRGHELGARPTAARTPGQAFVWAWNSPAARHAFRCATSGEPPGRCTRRPAPRRCRPAGCRWSGSASSRRGNQPPRVLRWRCPTPGVMPVRPRCSSSDTDRWFLR